MDIFTSVSFNNVVAGASGAFAHLWLTAKSPEASAASYDTVATTVIGLAGGLLGGLLLDYYSPNAGMLLHVGAGVAGMLVYDYALFKL